MIGKKIPNPDKSAAKAVRIRALATYIHTPQTDNAIEKCLYWGTRGFLTEALDTQIAEMIALAEDARRSADPIVHYVLSWREGERVSHAQVERAVDLVLEAMETPDHQVMYALHGDTDNIHLHIMLNRTHPETCRVVRVDRGLDRRALYRAVARIEHEQGWQRERRAPFRINEKGEIEDTEHRAAPRAPRPTPRQLDAEHRTGEPSAARRAIETAGPLIEAARTWAGLHEALAERGMRYARTGSGATVQVAEVFVKASTVSRQATLARLERRLGPYQAGPALVCAREATQVPTQPPDAHCAPAASARVAAPMEAPPLIEAARSWQDLHRALAERDLHYVKKGSGALIIAGAAHEGVSMKASAVSRKAALRRLEARFGPYEAPRTQEEEARAEGIPHWEEYLAARERHCEIRLAAWTAHEAEREAEERTLAERQREERDALFRERAWHGRLWELRALRAMFAAEHAREKAQHRVRRRARENALRIRHAPFPDYPQWVGDAQLVFLWQRRTLADSTLEPQAAAEHAPDAPVAHDIRDYRGRVVDGQVLYATERQRARGEVAFVDRGRRITLHERDSDAAARAALQLAAEKWGAVRARGSWAHRERIARLAAELDITLTNPELQTLIERHRRDIAERREEEVYGPESARLAREIRRITHTQGKARLLFDPPLRAGDTSAPRRITVVDATGARHDMGQHDMGTVARAKACARGRPPCHSFAALREALQARRDRAAAAAPDPSPRRRSGYGIGD